MSHFKPRNLLAVLALILAVVLLAIIVTRYRPDNKLPLPLKALPEGVDVSLQDIDYTHIEDGRARWRLVSQQVERESASGVMGLRSPRLTFFDEAGADRGTVQADSGEVSSDYRLVRLTGKVVLQDSRGYKLYTDHLDYDHGTQQAITDAQVRLVADGLSLEGSGLVFDLRQGRLLLKEGVNGSIAAKRKTTP